MRIHATDPCFVLVWNYEKMDPGVFVAQSWHRDMGFHIPTDLNDLIEGKNELLCCCATVAPQSAGLGIFMEKSVYMDVNYPILGNLRRL